MDSRIRWKKKNLWQVKSGKCCRCKCTCIGSIFLHRQHFPDLTVITMLVALRVSWQLYREVLPHTVLGFGMSSKGHQTLMRNLNTFFVRTVTLGVLRFDWHKQSHICLLFGVVGAFKTTLCLGIYMSDIWQYWHTETRYYDENEETS